MKKTILIIAVSLVAFGAIMYTGRSGESASHEEEHEHAEAHEMANITLSEEQIKAVTLATSPIEFRDMDLGIKANGRLVVRAQNTAEVSSTMAGVVRKIYVNEGDKVE